MLRKRLLAAVIVREKRAVQSFGYNKWLPLGNVQCVVENLDRWGADGIVVLCTDRKNQGPDLELLRSLCSLDLSTPLSYGGGISNSTQALEAVQAGAERLILDQVLDKNPTEVINMAAAVGKQALIASVPVIRTSGGIAQRWKYWEKKQRPLEQWLTDNCWRECISEILAIDVKAEGHNRGLNIELLEELSILGVPLLGFGGLSMPCQITEVLKKPFVSAVVIGNALNYEENMIAKLKDNLHELPLRPHPSNKTYNSINQ